MRFSRLFRITVNRHKVLQLISILVILSLLWLSRKPARLNLVRWKSGIEDLEFDKVKAKCINQTQVVRKSVDRHRNILPGRQTSYNDRNLFHGRMQDLEPRYSTLKEILELAKYLGTYYKTVLVSVINDSYIPFLYSWLCNTEEFRIHSSVLVITTDLQTLSLLRREWAEVNAVAIDLNVPSGNQGYSKVGYVKIMVKRAELLFEILKEGVNIMLTEFDYVWFGNPVPLLQNITGADILINPVSLSDRHIFNGGLIYTFASEKSIKLWEMLVYKMRDIEQKIQSMPDHSEVPETENDQQFFSELIRKRYADVVTYDLPLETYADGWWYYMSESQRNAIHPILISNNFIEGNVNKMRRAIQWGHWFLRNDCTCDTEKVRKVVKPSTNKRNDS